ncbi:nuclear transport factor 2 family protein [Actinacidiphila glaucinigra]|uniref:nuclear transport factor 2 family protein n=1 Tax=Actinacidiphila glaucinigra TaxID=235986 RepID=UPI0033A4B3E2
MAITRARISEALRALVFEPEPGVALDEILDRYYAPDYTHRNNGDVLSREQFAAMVAGLRNRVTGGTLTVVDEICDGTTYAERHTYRVTLADGSTLHREVAVFGTHAEDGRFRHLSDAGFDLPGDAR